MLFGLAASEHDGLNHLGEHEDEQRRRPDLLLTEIGVGPWRHHADILSMDGDEEGFTLEPGQWRPIVRHYRNGAFVVHSDYASDAGWTIRFGEGEFGKIPRDGAVFEAAYRTGLGSGSNLPAGTISVVEPPDGAPSPPALARSAASATRCPPPAASILKAPSVPPARARISQRLSSECPPASTFPRDRRARGLGATRRRMHAVGWQLAAPFVTADPLEGTSYTPDQRRALTDRVDAVRMAGRDAIVRDPAYVPVDLEISICIEDGHYPGHVLERATRALAGQGADGRPAYFDPDNLSFGDPLLRGGLEAAVQAVPGVAGVVGICIRQRGTRNWEKFEAAEFRVAMHEILRMDNDPAHPEWGSLKVRVSESASGAGCACCQS